MRILKLSAALAAISTWKSVLDEAKEIVWIVLVVGGLSAVAVGIAVALAVS
jgi:hypothetical protein